MRCFFDVQCTQVVPIILKLLQQASLSVVLLGALLVRVNAIHVRVPMADALAHGDVTGSLIAAVYLCHVGGWLVMG